MGSVYWLHSFSCLFLIAPPERSFLSLTETHLEVGEAGVLPRVLVDEVKRVAGEGDAAGLLALAEEGVLVVADLPDEVGGDVGAGHFGGGCFLIREWSRVLAVLYVAVVVVLNYCFNADPAWFVGCGFRPP